MGSRRKHEFDKGPVPERSPPPNSNTSADNDQSPDGDGGDDGDGDGDQHYRVTLPVDYPRLLVGAGAGVGAFLTVYLVFYQAMGSQYGWVDEELPSDWVLTGLGMLANQGATLEYGEEAVPLDFGFVIGISPIAALIPVVVLVFAGYVLARLLELRTPRDALITGIALACSYGLLNAVLARFATFTPDEEMRRGAAANPADGQEELETFAVAIDSSLLVAVVVLPLVFVLFGMAVWALSRVRVQRVEDDVSSR